jgi:hypothetical protein
VIGGAGMTASELKGGEAAAISVMNAVALRGGGTMQIVILVCQTR